MFKYIIFFSFYILLGIYVFISLASYESQFIGDSGDWYSKETMDSYQYASYFLTYVFSFPIGTILSVFESDFLNKKWFILFIPNLFFLFYLFIKIEVIIRKRANKSVKKRTTNP